MSQCTRAIKGAIFFLFAFSLPLGVLAQDDDPDAAKFKTLTESDTMIMMPMRDGVGLATDVYKPKGEGPFPVIFVKTPYNFNKITG